MDNFTEFLEDEFELPSKVYLREFLDRILLDRLQRKPGDVSGLVRPLRRDGQHHRDDGIGTVFVALIAAGL